MMSVANRKPKHQVETEYLVFWDDSESRNLGCPPPVEGLMASLGATAQSWFDGLWKLLGS